MAERLNHAIQKAGETVGLLRSNWLDIRGQYSDSPRDEYPLSEFPKWVLATFPDEVIIPMLHAVYGKIVRDADDYSGLLEGNFDVPRWYFVLYFGCSPDLFEDFDEHYNEGAHDFDELYRKVRHIREKRIRKERGLSESEPISEKLPLTFEKVDFQTLSQCISGQTFHREKLT